MYNKEAKKAYYLKNKEKIQARKKAHRLANIDIYKAKDKERYLADIEINRSKARDYHHKNKELLSVKKKTYRESLKDDFYTMYYIPQHHYIGITNQPIIRIRNHSSVGRITTGYEVVSTFETKREALDAEKYMHSIGYCG
jgi:hypothetical protein